ncbi:MAG: hypothetical protein EXX96DRAFT_527314 [Benjaminiella poitrasii]|nr:MAG: hypothetical protein EXX96DRAFT_527314 [Benjaminiella poitrasii]
MSHSQESFSASFWSPAPSIEPIPNYTKGIQVLYDKLSTSVLENEAIIAYLQKRVDSEKRCAELLTTELSPAITLASDAVESTMNASLKSSFDMVCRESSETAHGHSVRAGVLAQDVLEPLVKFTEGFQQTLKAKRTQLEDEIHEFEHTAQTALMTRSVYWSRCHVLELMNPQFRPPVPPGRFLGKNIFEWVRDYITSPPPTSAMKQQNDTVTLDGETMEICHHLVALKFLRSVQNMTLEVPSSTPGNTTNTFNGFLSRFKLHKKQDVDPNTRAYTDMIEADEAYKRKIKAVDKMRKKLEESLFVYFDEMEQLEIDRVSAIKQAFTAMASALADTLPMFKETYNRITLFQETLKPEQDIRYIVEQCKTGLYCPRPMIYENYYYGSAIGQIFGVPLEEVAQIYGSYVPPIITRGIKLIASGLSLKRKDEMEKAIQDIWCNVMPMKELNIICDTLDSLAGTKLKESLETYDLPVLANLIRMYLLELPECLLTFDLYEPIKIIYATQQDTQSRLISLSKMLATLPSTNYHTLKALAHHLFKLLKSTEEKSDNLLNQLISNFDYILMRPRTYMASNIHDRHPRKLMRDLLTHYDIIFTKDINRAQRSSANRSAIVANTSFFGAPEEERQQQPTDDSRTSFSSNELLSNTESALRRTLMTIMRRNSAETGSRQPAKEDIPGSPNSSGPPLVPYTKITLFEDPEKSKPTPKHSGASTPHPESEESITTTNGTKIVMDDVDRIDPDRLSTDVSLMLDMDGQDDAVEIADKVQVDRGITPNRSRASTRGTLDNVDLDPFFEDN